MLWVIDSVLEIAPLYCNFDTSICGFSNAADDDFEWVGGKGPTTSFGTGPSSDHTTGTQNGE